MRNAKAGAARRKTVVRVIARALGVVAVLATVVTLWVVLGQRASRKYETVPAAQQEPPSVRYVVVEPATVPLQPMYLAATEASQVIEIRSRVRGFLESQHFIEGGSVQPGQPLFQIDAAPFEAEAAVAVARMRSAEATLRRAMRQVERYEELHRTGAATEAEVEEWNTLQSVAEAELELEIARLAQARLDLSYTTVVSPIQGVIGRPFKYVGSLVDDGANSLLAIVHQVDPMYVRFSMSEREILRWRRDIAEGRINRPNSPRISVELHLSDGSVYPHLGSIDFIDVQVDPETSSAIVLATTPNPEGALRPGQFVEAKLLGFERRNAIVIPRGAVMQTPTGASVYVLDASHTVHSRPVTLGDWVDGGGWVIASGIVPGDLVIVSGLTKIQPGMQVRARAWTPDADEDAPEDEQDDAAHREESRAAHDEADDLHG